MNDALRTAKAIQSDADAILDPTAQFPDEDSTDPYELIIFLVEKYGHARAHGSCLGIKSADWHRRIGAELRRLFALREAELEAVQE